MRSVNFGIALAISSAVLWIVCVAIVGILPGPSMTMTGHMVHSDFSGMNWQMSFGGIALGLLGWVIFAGIFGFLAAKIYNFLNGKSTIH